MPSFTSTSPVVSRDDIHVASCFLSFIISHNLRVNVKLFKCDRFTPFAAKASLVSDDRILLGEVFRSEQEVRKN